MNKLVLPSVACFDSVHDNKFLRYCTDKDQSQGLLKFCGETVFDTLAQFQVIYTDDKRFVHLQSRYNNKYLIRWSPETEWISASADKQIVDQSNWGCTLFEPSWLDNTTIRLKHVQQDRYAWLSRTNDAPFKSCLTIGLPNTDPDLRDRFKVTDWDSIHTLPRSVAFQGNNDKFLGTVVGADRKHYLKFCYDNATDKEVAQEVFSSPDGTVMIKSTNHNQYWRLGDGDLIYVDIDKPSSTNDATMFRVNVVSIDVVTLFNLYNTLYCHRIPGHSDDLLRANTPTADDSASLRVIHLASLPILPKFVAFKGDNDKFLGVHSYCGELYLQFKYDSPNAKEVAQEVITSPDGTVMIKSKYNGKYWKLNDIDWVTLDGDEPCSNDATAKFKVNAVDADTLTVTLLNMSNSRYCKRFTSGTNYTSMLKAATDCVDRFCKLEVTDLSS